MFDDYKIGQPLIYDFLLKSIKNHRIYHAYLFDTKNLINKRNFAVAFAKLLICNNNYTNNYNCGDCNICNRIDNNNFTEIKIIESDGLWIKKEQIIDLQKEFTTKPIEGNKKIYIIENCERLNKYAANSLLKFLEEPEEGIIAILLTDNLHQVLSTIVSRCQVFSFKTEKIEKHNTNNVEKLGISKVKIISLFSNSLQEYENNIKNDDYISKIDAAVQFIKVFEKEKENTLLLTKNIWHDYFENKDNVVLALNIIILFYKDVLNKLCNRNIELFNDYINEIKNVAEINDIIKIVNKIRILVKLKDQVTNNINNQLLVDKMIIEMAEV